MKIWPFDRFATAGGNAFLVGGGHAQGLAPFEKIRDAVGDRMEIMCEMHSLWTLPAAIRIGHALRDVAPFWVEDPIRMDDPATLRRFRDCDRRCRSSAARRWARAPRFAACSKRRRSTT